MKKGRNLLLLLITLFIGIIGGVFIGRNLPQKAIPLVISDEQRQTQSTESVSANLIDINTADASQFMTLPGIGETLARRIVEYRALNGRFHSIEELLQVEGIGQKKLEQMKHLIVVGG